MHRFVKSAARCVPLAAVVALGMISSGAAQTNELRPEINIVYPREGQQMRAVDSTFILGSVTPGASLTINGTPVPVYRTGGFLAFLEIDTGQFVFHLEAANTAGTSSVEWPVHVGWPGMFVPDSGVVILPHTIAPAAHLALESGDYLQVRFRGTPGCVGRFQIEGFDRIYPMVERRNISSLGDGGDVFAGEDGTGRVLEPPGTYTGVWQVPHGIHVDSARIRMRLSRDTKVADSLCCPATDTVFREYTECAASLSPGLVSVNAAGVPRVLELTDSVQILRFGPRLGYLTTFQPAGVRAVYSGENGDWVRLRLGAGFSGWVEKAKTRELPPGTPIPSGLVSYIRTAARPRWTDVTLDLSSPLPFKVSVDPEQLTLTLEIFGATTNTDWVRYDPNDDLIERIDWNQTDPGVYTLKVQLKQGPLWGYEADYRAGGLVLSVRRPPDLLRGLRGLTICVDPGHALDSGAIGPTGLTEKEANLGIALALRRELESNGARVVMTRTADVQVDLYDRPAIARAAEVDIFISVHNNAVPDGINPYYHNGTSSYYYHPFAKDLASAIHQRLVKATALSDFGLYHANFAVLRPTQYPSVLVECAFMIIPEQEESLGREKYQKRVAKGIARGIEDFISAARTEYTRR